MKSFLIATVFCHLFFFPYEVSSQTRHTDAEGYYLINLLDESPLFDTTRVRDLKAIARYDSINNAWKKWRTVQNFSFGKNRGSIPMIADLNALHPYFRDQVSELIRRCRSAGIRLAIVESYRTPAKQAEYFAMGRQYTNTGGGKSRHQYGVAVDVVPIVKSKAVWNNRQLWKKIGLIGEELGLRWGGRWHVLYDPGHFEWSGDLSKEEREAGLLPPIPAAIIDKYHNLDSELRQLRRYWNAWEVEQSMTADISQRSAVISNQ